MIEKVSKGYLNVLVKGMFRDHSDAVIIEQILPAIKKELYKRRLTIEAMEDEQQEWL